MSNLFHRRSPYGISLEVVNSEFYESSVHENGACIDHEHITKHIYSGGAIPGFISVSNSVDHSHLSYVIDEPGQLVQLQHAMINKDPQSVGYWEIEGCAKPEYTLEQVCWGYMSRQSLNDVKDMIVNLGITEGEQVLLHADLRIFFKLVGGVEGIIDVLREVVGKRGVLVTPSFTFSFPDRFDVQKSVSHVGGMTTLFSRQSDVKRVPDGMTSYYLLGSLGEKFIDRWDHSSYGESSIIGQLLSRGGKVLQLGTDILSPIHYVEQLVGVPYRELKRFEGVVNDGEITSHSYTDFYCRTQEIKKLIPDPIRKDYYSSKAEVAYFSKRPCRAFLISDFVEFASPRLARDPLILIER
jgi:aminoglycoside 3-N-acetyltransferase